MEDILNTFQLDHVISQICLYDQLGPSSLVSDFNKIQDGSV